MAAATREAASKLVHGSGSVLRVLLVQLSLDLDLALRRLLVRLFGLLVGDPELEEDPRLHFQLFGASFHFLEANLSRSSRFTLDPEDAVPSGWKKVKLIKDYQN